MLDLGTSPSRPTAPQAPHLLSVVVVSTDPRQRAEWSGGLLRLPGTWHVHECETVAEARAQAAATPVDLVLLDAALHDAGTGEGPSTGGWGDARVVVVGVAGGRHRVREALEGGAHGYLLPRRAADVPVPPAPDPAPAPFDGITRVADVEGVPRPVTRRELEIVQLVAHGASNTAVAARLGLSPLTVKSHLNRIGRRLGAGDRAHLVLLALRSGAIR